MEKFKFKIDEKSLFYGMKNDYALGQTATVSTPINQSTNPEKWHYDILELTKFKIESKGIPEMLLRKCTKKTTSEATSKINFLFEFKDLLLDGIKLNCSSSFAMYIKEETDAFIINRKGKEVVNTHLGRKKLHYPISLQFKTDGFNIDNAEVLESILKQNGGFAYVVRMFEYSVANKTLNFITTMVGPQGALLSNVFKRGKGAGKKLLLNEIDVNDYGFINDTFAIVEKTGDKDIQSVFELANKTKAENGKLGEDIVLEKLKETLLAEDIYHTSLEFPTSPYDIEYYENGIKKYVEVKATQANKQMFHMSMGEIKFMNQYKDNYILFLVTNVKDKVPIITTFTCDRILKLRTEYPTTRFFA